MKNVIVTNKMTKPEDIPSLPGNVSDYIDNLVEMGMIPKSSLEDDEVYLGKCRNATIAKWVASKNRFIHWRTKWGSSYEEMINHPEDDDGFDLFVPIKKLRREEYRTPKGSRVVNINFEPAMKFEHKNGDNNE